MTTSLHLNDFKIQKYFNHPFGLLHCLFSLMLFLKSRQILLTQWISPKDIIFSIFNPSKARLLVSPQRIYFLVFKSSELSFKIHSHSCTERKIQKLVPGIKDEWLSGYIKILSCIFFHKSYILVLCSQWLIRSLELGCIGADFLHPRAVWLSFSP